MEIKIPKSFAIKGRPYNIGESDLELHDGDLQGSPSKHPLFIYMLKYLMAPMDEGLSDISKSMRVLLQPKLLDKVAKYTHDMEVDEEEYIRHIQFAWKELNESIMYSKTQLKDDEGKEALDKEGKPMFAEKGLLHLLVNQTWVPKEDKEVLLDIRRSMPERGKASQFNEILDTVDATTGKPSIGRIGQQKIMGYRQGERSAKLYNAALGKVPFKPVLDILKRVEEHPGGDDLTLGKIGDSVIIEYLHHPKTRRMEGRDILDMREITIHFDEAFEVLRKEYGMNMTASKKEPKEEDDETIENSDVLEKWENLIQQDNDGMPTKQFPIGDINPDARYVSWKKKNWDVDVSDIQNLTDKEKYYLRRINLKLEWDKQLDSESVDEQLIMYLYLYRIINKDKMKDYLMQNSKGSFLDKYGESNFEYNNEEFALIGKLLDGKEDKDTLESKLMQEYKIQGMSKIAEKEAKRLRQESRPLIQGDPEGQFAEQKLFDDIGSPDLSKIDLENVSSREFREELNKAITPGIAHGGEGKLKFIMGKPKGKDSGGYLLLEVKFTPHKPLKYSDYYAKTGSVYGEWTPGKNQKGKFIPSGYGQPRKRKPKPDRAQEGGQTLWIDSIPNATMTLYYLKKQLMRLKKMVKDYV